jgi:hypothetical protein
MSIDASGRGAVPVLDEDGLSLWVWERARDFEREEFHFAYAPDLLARMSPAMIADIRRILPEFVAFYAMLAEALEAGCDPRPYHVLCRRQDGGERLFKCYATGDEAAQVAARLAEIGCPARVAFTEPGAA